jgi:hypothetical protein
VLLQSDDTSNRVISDVASLNDNRSELAEPQEEITQTPIRDKKPAHLSYADYYWSLSLQDRDAYMCEFKDLAELLIYMDNFLSYEEVSQIKCYVQHQSVEVLCTTQ